MDHPELIAVPVLMLADYLLTILGARSSATVYRNHFATPAYELNPLWRKSVDRVRWFNPRHFALVVLICGFLLLVDEAELMPDSVFEVSLGMIFGAFGALMGRHLANLLLFGYLNRHPEEISGEVQLSLKLVLMMSQVGYLGLLPLFALLAVLAPGPYTLGALLGLLVLVLAHFIWGLRAGRAHGPSQQS